LAGGLQPKKGSGLLKKEEWRKGTWVDLEYAWELSLWGGRKNNTIKEKYQKVRREKKSGSGVKKRRGAGNYSVGVREFGTEEGNF